MIESFDIDSIRYPDKSSSAIELEKLRQKVNILIIFFRENKVIMFIIQYILRILNITELI